MSEQVLRGGNVMERSRTRTLTQIAMLGAVAGVLMNFEFPIPFLAPSFYPVSYTHLVERYLYLVTLIPAASAVPGFSPMARRFSPYLVLNRNTDRSTATIIQR